jgi:hypothetical protein
VPARTNFSSGGSLPGTGLERRVEPRNHIVEPGAGGERETFACEARPVAGEQPSDDLDGFAEPGQQALLVEPELVEPGACHQAEVRATAEGNVQRRNLARDLHRVKRLRVQRGRPEPQALGHARNGEPRHHRRLEGEVVEDRDHVEPRCLCAASDRLVVLEPLVRLETEPELERCQVRSSVRKLEPVLVRELPLLRGQEWENGLQAYRQKCRPSGIRTRLDSVSSK